MIDLPYLQCYKFDQCINIDTPCAQNRMRIAILRNHLNIVNQHFRHIDFGFTSCCFLGKTLDSNDQNQVADQRFSLKHWFAGGVTLAAQKTCLRLLFKVFRFLGSTAMMLGYQASDSETNCDFSFTLFFSIRPTDRPTQYQERHSTLNEKKGGMALSC